MIPLKPRIIPNHTGCSLFNDMSAGHVYSVRSTGALMRQSYDDIMAEQRHGDVIVEGVDYINSLCALYSDRRGPKVIYIRSSSGETLYNVRGHTVVYHVKADEGISIGSVGFSSRGRYPFYMTENGIHLLDSETSGDVVISRYQTMQGLLSANIHDLSSMIICGHRNGMLSLFDIKSKRKIFSYKAHGAGIHQTHTIDQNNSLRRVITLSYDGSVRLWDLRFLEKHVLEFQGHVNKYRDVSSFVSEECLAIMGTDRHVRLWDIGNPYCANAVDASEYIQKDENLSLVSIGKRAMLAGSLSSDSLLFER